jgi:hypothetical protein
MGMPLERSSRDGVVLVYSNRMTNGVNSPTSCLLLPQFTLLLSNAKVWPKYD